MTNVGTFFDYFQSIAHGAALATARHSHCFWVDVGHASILLLSSFAE